jgi:snurportin-1
VPNTHLRSRLLGKSLVRPFPSPLPAHTILDCVLDEHWRATGLLHVLDVVKWKSQDVGDCETAFRSASAPCRTEQLHSSAPHRFWFRDARLSELPAPTPPLALRAPAADPAVPAPAPAIEPAYRFPYPCTFLPVPYTTDTSLPALLSSVIPAARAVRALDLLIPRAVPAPAESDGAMAPAPGPSTLVPAAPGALQHFAAARGAAAVRPDGLLLYVREAAYEPGASPLSSWVPVELAPPPGGEAPRPLDLFEWLVRRRAAAGGSPAADGEAMVE